MKNMLKILVLLIVAPVFTFSLIILTLTIRLIAGVVLLILTVAYRIRFGKWPPRIHADHPYN